ncbi:MAG: WXG100 family type VII secretion target [Pirellulales bacterium]|nr:WXG100 family type VII secretion target [Pirellulales bacterium]
MPQAIVDPEALRQFARYLQKFNHELQDRFTVLSGQLTALGKTWRDQEQKKFIDEFEQQARSLARFIEMSEQHIPYLLRKAELIDQYLQQR